MTSAVLIANRALAKLGQSRIVSLDDPSKAATTISAMYDTVLDAELRAHLWHFSKARAVLPALAEAPLFGFSKQYQLPADFLRLIEIGGNEVFYRHHARRCQGLYSIEGRRLLTNLDAPLQIRYVKRVGDPNQFDSTFIEAFAGRLAMEACETLTQSTSKFQVASQLYARALRDAISANAIERPSQAVDDDTWLDSRR